VRSIGAHVQRPQEPEIACMISRDHPVAHCRDIAATNTRPAPVTDTTMRFPDS
jgi:hypothetical protein